MPFQFLNTKVESIDTIDGKLFFFYASKKIKRDDEIFFDYGK